MKKSDLKTGTILEFVGGELGMVLLGTKNGDIVSGSTWFPLEDYSDKEMFINIDHYASVKAVYQPRYNKDYLKKGVSIGRDFITVWKRTEPKEMTLADIEAELGYPVKIIGGQYE